MDSELSCKRLGDILSEISTLKMEYEQVSNALKVYHAKNAKDREDKRERIRASENGSEQATNVSERAITT